VTNRESKQQQLRVCLSLFLIFVLNLIFRGLTFDSFEWCVCVRNLFLIAKMMAFCFSLKKKVEIIQTAKI